MWVNGEKLNRDQLSQAYSLGYPNARGLSWYITARGDVSARHKPRQGGLDDQDVSLILTALQYLALSPHLPMVADGATRDNVHATYERVCNELFSDDHEGRQGRVDD